MPKLRNAHLRRDYDKRHVMDGLPGRNHAQRSFQMPRINEVETVTLPSTLATLSGVAGLQLCFPRFEGYVLG